MTKAISSSTQAKIDAWKQQRADLRLIAETFKRACPEATVEIHDDSVSIGGGADAYKKRKSKD